MADIVRYAGQGFIERSRRWINGQHEKVLTAITRCRTAALGGHRDQCAGCGHTAISYNSCRNRHCPKCQGNARIRGPSEVPALQRNHARRRTLSIGSTASPLSTAHRQVRRMILPTPASNGLGATASLPALRLKSSSPPLSSPDSTGWPCPQAHRSPSAPSPTALGIPNALAG